MGLQSDNGERKLPCALGRYTLTHVLGRGGMATVYGAELLGPAGFKKQVALKVLKASLLAEHSGPALKLISAEARLGALLRHQNIVDTYELSQEGDELFIAMELIDGETLFQIIKRKLKPPPSVLMEIASGIAAGLAKAHSLTVNGQFVGLVHRDLKASNILISWDGAVKIADFGIAVSKFSEGNSNDSHWGTVAYMSPEQTRGEGLDARSDVFSFALLIYVMVTGTRLFGRYGVDGLGSDAVDYESSSFSSEAAALADSIVPGLSSVLTRALYWDRNKRYQDVSDMLTDLDAIRVDVGIIPRLSTWLMELKQPPADFVEVRVAAPKNLDAFEKTIIISGSDVRQKTNIAKAHDSFIGRQDALAKVVSVVESGAKLITIKAMGGVGKTRLCKEYARSVSSSLVGGAWFVDLSDSESVDEIVQTCAAVLGVPLDGVTSQAEMIVRVGRAIASRGEMLLVLDNFEQVVSLAAETVGAWREQSPETLFILTSREPVRLVGEFVVTLDPMSLKDGTRLFRQRSRAVGAQWEKSAENSEAIDKIVTELDCIPLAIELAAGRANTLPPVSMLGRLSERFKLLRTAQSGVSQRQSTLRGLIDWSWELLTPWEKAALVQLASFRGGFFMESAERVVQVTDWPEAPWCLDIVGSLFDKSLLTSEQVGGQPRFFMYASVREYAFAKADKYGVESMAKRHAEHFGRFGGRDFMAGLSSRDGVRLYEELGLEYDNISAAFDFAVESGDSSMAVPLAIALAEIVAVRGTFVQGAESLGRIASMANVSDSDLSKIKRQQGWCLYRTGKIELGLAVMEEAVEHAVVAGDDYLKGLAMERLCRTGMETLGLDRALRMSTEAIALLKGANDLKKVATAMSFLGVIHMKKGDFAAAEPVLRKALEYSESLGDYRSLGYIHGNLGLYSFERGDLDAAAHHQEAALEIHRCCNSVWDASIATSNLGLIDVEKGRYVEAEARFLDVIRISRSIGSQRDEGIDLGNLGDLMIKLGRRGKAIEYLLTAIDVCDPVVPSAAGAFRGSLALLYAEDERYEESQQMFDVAEPQLVGTHAIELAKFLCKRGQAHLLRGDAKAANAYLFKAKSLATNLTVNATSELAHGISELEIEITGKPNLL